jgi:hypothetical protein
MENRDKHIMEKLGDIDMRLNVQEKMLQGIFQMIVSSLFSFYH